MPTDEEGQLLVVLLDTHMFIGPVADEIQPDILLQQLVVFINSYLLLNERNKLAVIAVHERTSPVLHAGREDQGVQQRSAAEDVVDGIRALLKDAAAKTATDGNAATATAEDKDIPLSGALSRALCYIHRHYSAHSGGRVLSRPRILCLHASPDATIQYVATMNAIFSAQRLETVIDAIKLHAPDSAFLQQAAHLTGGLYLRPSQPSGLLQYMLTSFTADTHTRGMLNVPKPQGVDFRAACFCHKRVIDIGYACSVCLSIFCEPLKECSTCGSPFNVRRVASRPSSGTASASGMTS